MRKPTVKDCAGCRDNFYNGHNSLGVQRCWNLDSAQFEKVRFVPIDQRPPYNDIPLETRPNCYRIQRFVRVKPETLTPDGYWK